MFHIGLFESWLSFSFSHSGYSISVSTDQFDDSALQLTNDLIACSDLVTSGVESANQFGLQGVLLSLNDVLQNSLTAHNICGSTTINDLLSADAKVLQEATLTAEQNYVYPGVLQPLCVSPATSACSYQPKFAIMWTPLGKQELLVAMTGLKPPSSLSEFTLTLAGDNDLIGGCALPSLAGGFCSSTSTALGVVHLVSPASYSQSQTLSLSSAGGGIPEFPYQLIVVSVFTILVVASYLLAGRRRFVG